MFLGSLGELDISLKDIYGFMLVLANPVEEGIEQGIVKGMEISLEIKTQGKNHFSLDLKSNFVKFGGREIIEMEILLGSRKRLIDQPECLPR